MIIQERYKSLNLRKKLIIASILMILIPLLVSVLLCVMLIFYKGDSSLNRLKSIYENDNGFLNVQTILYSHEDQILSYTPLKNEDAKYGDHDSDDDGYGYGYYDDGSDDDDDDDDDDGDDREHDDDGDDSDDNDDGDDDDDDDDIADAEEDSGHNNDDIHAAGTIGNGDLKSVRSDDSNQNNNKNSINYDSAQNAFGDLINELEMIRYYYQIRCDGQVIVSNLPEYAEKEIAGLAGAEYMATRNFAVTDGEDSVVKRSYTDGVKTLDVMAYCNQYDSSHYLSQIIRDFFVLIIFFMVVLTATIIISIIILTKWLSRGMRSSLGQLSEAVRQVQDGNLSYRIRSQKKDELGKACQEFDEMAEYLENSVKEQEKYEESRKQMLAGISHDLRTPLTSVKAYVEGLRDGIANTEEKRQRYYRALKTRIADLEALIDNLSLLSRFDRGEYHYSMERIELGEFLSQFFQENAVEFQEHHITLDYDIQAEEPLHIIGDKKQLRRLLGNLIDNTLKYREKEETRLKTVLYKAGGKIVLEMEDDGPGVPPEERELIFDTFYRGDKARSDPGGGSGLGLSIVKEILKGHKAAFYAKAGREGKGLRLVMEFPSEKGEKYEKNSNCGR